MSDNILKVIVPAWKIPNEATVTKRTGNKKYLLRRGIMMYSQGELAKTNKPKHIEANDGTVFLISDNGNIEVYAGHTEFVWYADYGDIYQLMEGEPK